MKQEYKKNKRCQEWFYTSVAQPLGRLKQSNQEFKTTFFCLNTQKSFLRTVSGSQRVAVTRILTYSQHTVSTPAETYTVTSEVPTPNTTITDFIILHTVFPSEAELFCVCADSGLAAQLPRTHSEEDRERCCTILAHHVKIHRCDDWFNKTQDGQ